MVLLLALAVPAASRDCDRTCTLQVSDAVLTALQTGQFGKLLARRVRVTANARDIRPADSQLRAFRKVTYLHPFAEPLGGATGFNGAAEADGGAALFSMRLKLKGDQVAEVDYLTGDDAYKRDWMSASRERCGIIAFNLRSPRGLAAAALHLGGGRMKALLRRRRRVDPANP